MLMATIDKIDDSMDREELLNQLNLHLSHLQQQWNEYLEMLENLTVEEEKILVYRNMLKLFGVVVIKEKVDETSSELIKSKVVATYNQTFKGESNLIHESQTNRTFDQTLKLIAAKSFNNGGGKYGSKITGMINRQPLYGEYEKYRPQYHLENEIEVCQMNPFYNQVNIWCLSQPWMQDICDDILNISGNAISMISVDSIKLAGFHNNRGHRFTVPHIDHYFDETNRLQIILNVSEERNKLFYCVGSSNEVVKKILKILQPKFYPKNHGFSTLNLTTNADTEKILRNFMIAPPPNSIVCWKSDIIHSEYKSTEMPDEYGLYRALNFEKTLDQLTLRLYIGTHIPIHLSLESWLKFGYAAQKYSMVPSRYTSNKDGKYSKYNKMNKGSTQYKVTKFDNKELLRRNKRKMDKLDTIPVYKLARFYLELPDRVAELLGVPLSNVRGCINDEESQRFHEIVKEHQSMVKYLSLNQEQLRAAIGSTNLENNIESLKSIIDCNSVDVPLHLQNFIDNYVPESTNLLNERIAALPNYSELEPYMRDEPERYRRLIHHNSVVKSSLSKLLHRVKTKRRRLSSISKAGTKRRKIN
eukprot:TRINITY_DN8426_c0_g1_i1.p1 TRINITY_DN8426_c0_g1~~TRINITY_DN8426_c0_g1_i1.p1  ORF type:complete len:586 (+),score=105.19 TRINITY_DN8426_c0_g1_i1:84-1841(+)